MNKDTELALKAIDEIEDIDKWKDAFMTEIAERTLQNELSKDAENSAQIVTMKGEVLIKNFPEIFQNVCLNKLTEYKHTILEQREEIQIKEKEVLNLKEQNFQFKEMAHTFAANVENLKEFLDKADASNSSLRTENQSLHIKLNTLESSIADIEEQHANFIKDLVREEQEKYQVNITQLEFLVNQQKDIIQKLEQDVQEYNLLKKENEILTKENSKIDFLKKENNKLEEALTELNKDYQETILLLAKEQCMSPYNLQDGQVKEFVLSNRSKNSTTTSRNVEESDDETQNKNNILSKESSNLTPRKSPSRHLKGQSLMEEVIITKFSTTPTSNNEQNNPLLNKYIRQQKKYTSNSHGFKSIDLTGKTYNHSNSLDIIQIALPDQTQKVESNSALASNNEAESATKKSREIVASDLGSDGEPEVEQKIEKTSSKCAGEAEQDLLRMFGDEKVMQSWDEEDFKRLPSMVSMISSKKGSAHGSHIKLESLKESFRRPKGRASSGNFKRKYATAVKEKRPKRNGASSHSHSVSRFPPEINTDSTPPEHNKSKSVHIGLLLRQKLEQLKSREELRHCLHKQDLSVSMQSFENLNLETAKYAGDEDSVIAVEELEENMEGSPLKRNNISSDLMPEKEVITEKVEILTTPLFQFSDVHEDIESTEKLPAVESPEQKPLHILSYLEKRSSEKSEKEIQTLSINMNDQFIQTVSVLTNEKDIQTASVFTNEKDIQTASININDQDTQTISIRTKDQDIQTVLIKTNNQEVQTETIELERVKPNDERGIREEICDTTIPDNASQIRLSELNFSMIPTEKKPQRFEEMKTVVETEELKPEVTSHPKRSLLTSIVMTVIPFAIGTSLSYFLLKKRLIR